MFVQRTCQQQSLARHSPSTACRVGVWHPQTMPAGSILLLGFKPLPGPAALCAGVNLGLTFPRISFPQVSFPAIPAIAFPPLSFPTLTFPSFSFPNAPNPYTFAAPTQGGAQFQQGQVGQGGSSGQAAISGTGALAGPLAKAEAVVQPGTARVAAQFVAMWFCLIPTINLVCLFFAASFPCPYCITRIENMPAWRCCACCRQCGGEQHGYSSLCGDLHLPEWPGSHPGHILPSSSHLSSPCLPSPNCCRQCHKRHRACPCCCRQRHQRHVSHWQASALCQRVKCGLECHESLCGARGHPWGRAVPGGTSD